MKVALVQMNSGNDKNANLEQAETLMRQAIQLHNPQIILLPEMFNFMANSPEDRQRGAENFQSADTPGITYNFLQTFAKQNNVMIHGGSCVEKVGTHLYNTSLVFAADGREIARYRKIHLFEWNHPEQNICESDCYKPGEQVISYESMGATFGCSICFDIRFSGLYQELFKQGAQIMMLPSAFFSLTGEAHWEVLCRARAIETQSYVLAAAQTGTREFNGSHLPYWGHSLVVDPWGHVVASLQQSIGILVADIDLQQLKQVRKYLPLDKIPSPF